MKGDYNTCKGIRLLYFILATNSFVILIFFYFLKVIQENVT